MKVRLAALCLLLLPSLALANPAWEPGFWYEEDNFDREHWRVDQQAGFKLGEAADGFVRYSRVRFYEKGFESVTDDAVGAGFTRRFPGQTVAMEGTSHNFSDELSSIPGFRLALDSEWTQWLKTLFEAGRKPAETAQALRAGVRQHHAQLRGQWKPAERWTLQLFERYTSLSDRNHRYETEAQLGYAFARVPGLQAVYLFTGDNMVERSPAYYSPHRLKQHQAGLEYYGQPTTKSWVWSRYLTGYGKEQGVEAQASHSVGLSGGLQLTRRLSFNTSFEWSKSPTYRSTAFRCRFIFRF